VADGGRSALCGFLWQFMGASAIVAMGQCQGDDPHTPELDALVRAARQPGVQNYTEPFDQDLSLMDESGRHVERRCILAQFKYSRDQTASTVMDRGDINHIVGRLDIAAGAAQTIGYQPVAYVLVTNRTITRHGTAGHPRAQRLAPDVDLFMTGQPIPIQPTLYVAQGPSMQGWIDELRVFARRFGLDDDEIDDSIDRLMGHLLNASGGTTGINAVLDRQTFTRLFTGSADARFLTADDVALRFTDSLEPPRLPWKPDHPLVYRDILDEIIERAHRRATVVVHGPGGCGKTAALWQWADATADYRTPKHLTGFSGPFTSLDVANGIGSTWVPKVIAAWGGWQAGDRLYSDHPDAAWRRLRRANPDAELPILHLGLDGLDEDVEASPRRDAVRDVLRWFWEEDVEVVRTGRPPRATLVVTCRDGARTVEDILHLDRSGRVPMVTALEQVRVGDFSGADLRRAVAELSPDRAEIRRRLGEMISLVDEEGAGDDDTIAGLGQSPTAASLTREAPDATVDPDVFAALKHPATWEAFLSLDVESQSDILGGSNTVRLAREVVGRACRKAHQRHPSAFPYEEHLVPVLRDIARRTAYNPTSIRFVEWVAGTRESDLLSQAAVRVLYREAQSSGLIDEEGNYGLWRWRHKMVWEALTMGTDEDWSRL